MKPYLAEALPKASGFWHLENRLARTFYRVVETTDEREDPWSTVIGDHADALTSLRKTAAYYEKVGRTFALQAIEIGDLESSDEASSEKSGDRIYIIVETTEGDDSYWSGATGDHTEMLSKLQTTRAFYERVGRSFALRERPVSEWRNVEA